MAAEVVGESGGKLPKASAPKKGNSSKKSPAVPATGFFHVYKSGQGYWTRMMTFLGSMLIGTLTSGFLYSVVKSHYEGPKTHVLIGAVVFFVLWALMTQWIMNKPRNAEFLIATDDEMKKVNWTSRAELIGSTKVVILFMFLMTAALFLIDIIFSQFFYMIRILPVGPFGK